MDEMLFLNVVKLADKIFTLIIALATVFTNRTV